ncbi:MAG: pilus assembly protein PilM [Phycisphaerales bacterium]|nr:pilus assembly protein PilM [Phycisphaerales bacterium]
MALQVLGLFDNDIHPIGIDVGDHSVRLLQLRRKDRQLALQAAAHIDLNTTNDQQTQIERVTNAIKQSLQAGSGQEFRGKKVILSLPLSAVHSKSLRLPQMPDSDLSQVLPWEAKDRFGFDTDDGRLAWFRAGEVRRGTEVKDELLLFALRGESLTAHLDAISDLGFTAEAIDLAPCALHRAIQRIPSQTGSSGVTAILDVGCFGTQFIITTGGGNNDQLVFYKHIDMGTHAINETVSQKLGVTLAEAAQMRARLGSGVSNSAEAASLEETIRDAMRHTLDDLSRELDMCIRYFMVTFRGSRPDLVTLTGHEAKCAWFAESLATTLGIRVEAAQPLRGVLDLRDIIRPDRSGEWTLATGLSLYPLKATADGAGGGVAA